MILEITGDDIAALDDSDLRNLIGLLCEADYRRARLSTSGITWGGSQDAPDGGIDVRVNSSTNPPTHGHIKRRNTSFQVKKPDMQPAAIKKEMRPNGLLRDSIKELIVKEGAYVIVSSGASLTDSTLKNRTKAIRDCIVNEDPCENLHIDFYDRGRIATWVRDHPSLILWVRQKIGKPIQGWQPFGNWSNAPENSKDFLRDNESRVVDSSTNVGEKSNLSVEEGMRKMRNILRNPRSSIRLVGLSGVGKTRLVQALFDENVGGYALNASRVFYTDVADNPIPNPKFFAEHLIAQRTEGVIIVDNCPPDLHRKLTTTCSSSESTVSILTVEYDVRDDLPEETSVFRLEPASEALIQKLLQLRYNHINNVNASTIANFSGGNARIAIALANTVQRGETLSGLSDQELVNRLFWQRDDGTNQNLLHSAHVCSLLYSFDGESTESASELSILSQLAGTTVNKLYADVAELKNRDLIQKRSKWRAVLPHALANKLAQSALQSIPLQSIESIIIHSDSQRTSKSFSRRLGYLHDAENAAAIAEYWLFESELMENFSTNDPWQLSVLENLAPICPSFTLKFIVENVSYPTYNIGDRFYKVVLILRSIAYDDDLFYESVKALCSFSLSQGSNETQYAVRPVLKQLFAPRYSGTLATGELRNKIIQELIASESENQQGLGISLLEAAICTDHYAGRHEFAFGARLRTYGYWPSNNDEWNSWYETFYGICLEIIATNHRLTIQAQHIIAHSFQFVWSKLHFYDLLESISHKIHEHTFWYSGWFAVRDIISSDKNKFEQVVIERLETIEQYLRPTTVLERISAFVFRRNYDLRSYDDMFEGIDHISGFEDRLEYAAQTLGRELANDEQTFNLLLPKLVSTGSPWIQRLGQGFGEEVEDKRKTWNQMKDTLGETEVERQNVSLLLGFFHTWAGMHPDLSDEILNGIAADNLLSKWLPLFQLDVGIDVNGSKRLLKALKAGKTDVFHFGKLIYGLAYQSIPENDLIDFLEVLIKNDEGLFIGVDLLSTIYRHPSESYSAANALLLVGRKILLDARLLHDTKRLQQHDNHIETLSRYCFLGPEGKQSATQFASNLIGLLRDHSLNADKYANLFMILAQQQPEVFLDTFYDNLDEDNKWVRYSFSSPGWVGASPINEIKDKVILSWCERKPGKRYPIIARSVRLYGTNRSGDASLQWNPIFHALIRDSPDLDATLQELSDNIYPTSFSASSIAGVFRSYLPLWQSLLSHEVQKVSSWAKDEIEKLNITIAREEQYEKEIFSHKYQAFE